MKQQTKDYFIRLAKADKDSLSNEYNDSVDNKIKELEALEVEPESRFKKGEQVIVWHSTTKFIRTFSHMDGELFMTVDGGGWRNCAHFTEWQEYKGVKPELPEGAVIYLKFEDGHLKSYNPDQFVDWSQNSCARKVVEYSIYSV